MELSSPRLNVLDDLKASSLDQLSDRRSVQGRRVNATDRVFTIAAYVVTGNEISDGHAVFNSKSVSEEFSITVLRIANVS